MGSPESALTLYYYCERTGPGIWGEPVNTVSNIAFLLAAAALWRITRKGNRLDVERGLLISLIILMGVGSALFHALATRWAQFLDVVFIGLFELAYFWIYARRILQLQKWMVSGFLVLFVLSEVWVNRFSNLLNGSLMYAPPLITLIGLGIYHAGARQEKPFLILTACGMFLAALLFRTVDPLVCPHFPIGTHFLWHILSALLVFSLTLALSSNFLQHRNRQKINSNFFSA